MSSIIQKSSHIVEEAQKFLQNRSFWLLPKIWYIDVSFIIIKIIIKMMHNNVLYDPVKPRVRMITVRCYDNLYFF